MVCGGEAEKDAAAAPAPSSEPRTIEWHDLDFSPLQLIPVQSDARLKPLQVFAAEQLEQITGKPLFGSAPSYRPADHSHALTGLDLYFSILFQTRDWQAEPLILIPSAQARTRLGLPADQKLVSYTSLEENRLLGEVWHKRSQGVELSATEKDILDAATRMVMLENMLRGDELLIVPHPKRTAGAWLNLSTLFAAREQPDAVIERLAQDRFGGNEAQTRAVLDEYMAAYPAETVRDLQVKVAALADAYIKRDPEAFRTAGEAFRDALAALSPSAYPDRTALSREQLYHALRPFRFAWLSYLCSGLLGLALLRSTKRGVTVAVWALFGLGLAFHACGFALRCLIAGRAPVTNMYESVIWAALGCAILALVFELRSRKKYFLASGALAASILLLLMDALPIITGDPFHSGFDARIKSFDALVPVLKDHFWLTVHVLTITLSYGAFALAWILSHITLGRVLVHPKQHGSNRELMLCVYDVLKAGVFLLAVGTILGAFWGHYAWGRFWGWDSKETWSLITLLAYLVVLHLRFTEYWNDIDFAVGAAGCFLSVVMAWYGVNFVLGSGLHTYGAGSGGFKEVLVLVGLDLLFVIACLVRYLSNPKPTRLTSQATADGASTPEPEKAG